MTTETPLYCQLDEFTQAYLECVLWAETDQSDEQGGKYLDDNYDFADFHPKALQRAIDDCKRFQTEQADLLAEADYNHPEYSNTQMAGHDFWLTRNRHGAGFWDRDIDKKVGGPLTRACEKVGGCDVYVGDSNQLHFG